MATIATERGPRPVQLVLNLGNSQLLPAPTIMEFLTAKAAAADPPLLLMFNARVSQREKYQGSLFIRQSVIAILDPRWAHYDHYYSIMFAFTESLRSTDEAAAAMNRSGATSLPADTFRNPAYALAPDSHSHILLKTYNTDNPFIDVDGADTLCCPMEVVAVDGRSYNAAIVDDAIFEQLPYSSGLGSTLSAASKTTMLDFIGTNTAAAYADIEVDYRYGVSIITHIDRVRKYP